MKVDLIKKYKWYIFGAIAVVLIMSIGLSFCAWETNGINNLSINGGVANYNRYAFDDKNNNGNLDNGDIITNFGDFQLLVANTTEDAYYVVATCNVGNVVFSPEGNNDYMASNVRKVLNTTYLNKYAALMQYIKPNPLLEGDKIFLMSIEEATSNYFATVANRLVPNCLHTGNRWTWLRDKKAENTGYFNHVSILEVDGSISTISPQDDLPTQNWPFRYAMWLYK